MIYGIISDVILAIVMAALMSWALLTFWMIVSALDLLIPKRWK